MLKTSDFAVMALVLLIVVLAAALIPALTGPGMTLGRAALAAESSPAVGQGVEWALSLGIKVLLGGVAVGLAAGIVAYLRERGRQGGGRWQGGPNAFWRRSPEPRERRLTVDEMMRMLMMRQLMGGQEQGPVVPPAREEDEEVIRW